MRIYKKNRTASTFCHQRTIFPCYEVNFEKQRKIQYSRTTEKFQFFWYHFVQVSGVLLRNNSIHWKFSKLIYSQI